ncbi:leukocyte-associated immunoglobulin-like receptor 2-like protein [Camelus ferus]|nr:leukocyte-associated immunoglobulin-like receptor 2-like protein [Camelus ferus]
MSRSRSVQCIFGPISVPTAKRISGPVHVLAIIHVPSSVSIHGVARTSDPVRALAVICAPWTLPRPSISAEPDSVIPRGRPVTIVCRGPAGFKTFRLENEEDTNDFKDTRASSPLGPHQTEARFLIPAVSEGTATHYRCRYIKEHVWSEPSESLELVVTGAVDENQQSRVPSLSD